MKVISLKCPECNANISVEGERKYCFCQYCGTKIMFDDGSTTHTYRKVDEARIREADVKENIRLRELMLEERKLAEKEKNKALKIKISIILGVIGIVLTGIGLMGGAATDSIGVAGLAALAVLGCIWGFGNK